MNSKGALQVCVEERLARIRVTGSASFISSQTVQDFCVKALAAGATRCRFELAECLSLDSTFIGGMTVLVLPEGMRTGTVEILNASEKVRRQITSLGIDDLFVFLQQPETPGAWVALNAPSLAASNGGFLSKTMLDAHEVLGRANPENLARFKGVIDELKRDQSRRPPADGVTGGE